MPSTVLSVHDPTALGNWIVGLIFGWMEDLRCLVSGYNNSPQFHCGELEVRNYLVLSEI